MSQGYIFRVLYGNVSIVFIHIHIYVILFLKKKLVQFIHISGVFFLSCTTKFRVYILSVEKIIINLLINLVSVLSL